MKHKHVNVCYILKILSMQIHLTRLYWLTEIFKEMLHCCYLNEITQRGEQDLNQLWQLRQLHEITLLFTLNNVLCCASYQRVSKSSTRKVIFVLSSFKRWLVEINSPRNCVVYTQDTALAPLPHTYSIVAIQYPSTTHSTWLYETYKSTEPNNNKLGFLCAFDMLKSW